MMKNSIHTCTRKVYYFYNFIRSSFAWILATLFVSLNACTDEMTINNTNNGERGTGITLIIPNLDSNSSFITTRTDYVDIDESTGEGNINDLWLLAFELENSQTISAKAPIVIDLKSKDDEAVKKDYNVEYNINPNEINEGTYNFYVLANIISYLVDENIETVESKKIPRFENETALRLMMLNFGDNVSNPLVIGNLPMACYSSDIKYGANQMSVPSSGLEYNYADGLSLYADLTFQCAKVRYTILFDAGYEGFSEDFGSHYIDFNDNPTVSNIRNTTPFIYSSEPALPTFIQKENKPVDVWQLSLSKKNYPLQTDYPTHKTEDGEISINTPYANLIDYSGPNWENEYQRAWQGVVYLPENCQSLTNINLDSFDYESETNKMSYITYAGEYDNALIYYYHTLTPLKSSGNSYSANGIQRGFFYDILSKVTKYESNNFESSISVAPWTTSVIQADLQGVSELEVEKSSINVQSGEWSEMWYSANISPDWITFNIPQVDDMPFYEIEKVKNENDFYALDSEGHYQLRVRINPAISYDKLQKIKNNQEGYQLNNVNYFEIKAGKIVKKIKVEPLEVKGFLEISPREIIIDVREYITSGRNNHIQEISIETNVRNNIGYSCSDATIFSTNYQPLWITTKDDIISRNENEINIKDGKGTLVLNLDKFFDGDPFWKTPRTYDFTFSVTDDPSDYELNKSLKITVKPYNTDYAIHFKPVGTGWTNPHIYVYQCLEMPNDLKENDVNYQYRGKTVGYGDSNCNAGLEYAFTNNISFRGWKGYGGTVDPNEPNTTYSFGFVHLGGVGDGKDQRFNPEQGNTDIYNYATDLNSSHRNDGIWICAQCNEFLNPEDYNKPASTTNRRLFPGVSMIRETGENEGWYKYTLSGVATPGRTMIMFYDGHIWDGDDRRYPNKKDGKDPVGIPLFDYPDNEGWIVYNGDTSNNNQNFYDDKPDFITLRFYWPVAKGNGIYVSIDQQEKVKNNKNNGGRYNTDWYYVDIKVNDISGSMEYNYNNPFEPANGNTYKLGSINGKFIKGNGNIYHAYVDGVNNTILNAGIPSSGKEIKGTLSAFSTGDKIEMIFKNTWKNYIYIYWDGGYEKTDWPEWPGMELDPFNELTQDKKYIFTVPASLNGKDKIQYILNQNGRDDLKDPDITLNASDIFILNDNSLLYEGN